MNLPQEEGPASARPRRHGYEKVLRVLEARWKRRTPERGKLMQHIVDNLWDVFGEGAYSWCGFYVLAPDGASLTLGPHRDKAACSPIGAHGVCGKAVSTGTTQVVADVRALGDAHIECDPANRSEIAVPVRGPDGRVFAVLDVDSRLEGAFEDVDQRWLERIVRMLSSAPAPRVFD